MIVVALLMMAPVHAQEERFKSVYTGVRSIYVTGARGDKSLIEAISGGQIKIATKLIAAGADPNSTDDEGFSALHLAITNRLDEIALLLIKKGADVSYDFMGSSALFLARTSNCEADASGKRVIASLLKNGAKYTQHDLAFNELSLQVNKNKWRNFDNGYLKAIENGDVDVIKLFLILYPDPNQPIAKKYMPLHYAAVLGTKEVVRLLVEHGANVNAKTLEGTPVLFMARERPEIQNLLVELGAKEEPEFN